SDRHFRDFRKQGKPLPPSPTEPDLFLAKDDKLRNVLGVDQVVINIEPQEHFGRTSPLPLASPISALPRPLPAMPSPRPSSPRPTLWRHREAITPESTGYSFPKELLNRLGLQGSQAAPVPELRRSLQRQATSNEAIHKNGTDVQEELPLSMVDSARQPDRLDAKMEHAVFRAGRASDAGSGCITRWLPAALAREARRIRTIAHDRSTTPCGVTFEESDSVVEKLIEGIRPHPYQVPDTSSCQSSFPRYKIT
ncbi:hypothetical protein HPB47_018290, partial [Ixodes persulcatus]